MHDVRLEDVVVWNLDARYRPELEVELEVTYATPPKPAKALASGTPARGTAVILSDVDIPFVNLEELADEDLLVDDDEVVQ